jgi:hypothetical protein
MELPADLELALTVRQRLEQDAAGGNVGLPVDDCPRSETRVRSQARVAALDHLNGLATVLHRWSSEPPHDLEPPVNVEEAVGLLDPPWPNDDSLRLDYIREARRLSHGSSEPDCHW